MRPALPSVTEAELKAACAWVVANYKSSQAPHQEAAGIGVSTQHAQHVDYAAINAAVRREVAGEAPEPAPWPSVPGEQWTVNQSGNQWPSSDMFRYKPTETSKDVFQQDELEVMRHQRSSIMAKADELMANLEETRKVLLSPEIRSHSRSASNQSALSLPVDDTKAALRCDSMGTFTSTPRTDVTSGAWPDSTPATSAYVTPALQSKRTSHTHSDTYLPPKVSAVDAVWMRHELEKHLRAQEEDLTRKESPAQEVVAGLAETTPTQIAETPTSPTSIMRKPVPRRGTGESQNFSKPTDARQNKVHSRTDSQNIGMPTSPLAQHVAEKPSTSGRATMHDAQRTSYVNGMLHETQDPTRPGTAHTTVRPEAAMHSARSRAQSVKGHTQNFSRPSLDATSRRVSPGPHLGRPARRSRSADSFRSAVSSICSVESFNKPWGYSMMSQRRSRDSDVSMESLGTRVSEASRGRPRMPRHSPPPPPTDADRELPPMPITEKWKPVTVEMSSTPPETPAKCIQSSECPPEIRSDHGRSSQRQDSRANRHPTQPLTQTSPGAASIPTFESRQTMYFDAASSPLCDRPLAPANTRDPAVSPGLSVETRERHRRSKSVMEAASPELINHMSQVSLGNYSGEPRPWPRQLHSATHVPVEKRHSRNISGSTEAPNFSRKFSADDHSRMYDGRYQNMLEVRPSWSAESEEIPVAGTTVVPTKETAKSKRHWWQSKPKREETWMDTVVKSGSKSGVLLTDEVAGAPIVRY